MPLSNLIKRAGNAVLQVNPTDSYIDIHLTNHGSDWLWAAFSIFALLALVNAGVFAFTSSKTALKKALLVVPLFTNAILAYTYYTYASNLGYTGIATEFKHVSTSEDLYVRQIFYVKYIGWFLAWPFNLFAISVATNTLREAALTGTTSENFTHLVYLTSNFFTKVLSTEVFVLGLLIGSLIRSTYKWGYFTFAVTAQLFAMTLVGINVVKSLRSVSGNKGANLVILFQLIIWILYPINWGVSEGGNKIQPDSEAVFTGILDVINFAFIPTILTWLNVRDLDEEFFHNWFKPSHYSEKSLGETPRHSGDTAVPPAAVASNEEEQTAQTETV